MRTSTFTAPRSRTACYSRDSRGFMRILADGGTKHFVWFVLPRRPMCRSTPASRPAWPSSLWPFRGRCDAPRAPSRASTTRVCRLASAGSAPVQASWTTRTRPMAVHRHACTSLQDDPGWRCPLCAPYDLHFWDASCTFLSRVHLAKMQRVFLNPG